MSLTVRLDGTFYGDNGAKTLKRTVLENSVCVGCQFDRCEMSGAALYDAVFCSCRLEEADLYGCGAFRSTWIDCEFVRCDLRGSFDRARFVRCRFTDCEYGDNAMGGETAWEDAAAVACVVEGPPLPIVSSEEDWGA